MTYTHTHTNSAYQCVWASGWRSGQRGAGRAVWGGGRSACWADSALSWPETSWYCGDTRRRNLGSQREQRGAQRVTNVGKGRRAWLVGPVKSGSGVGLLFPTNPMIHCMPAKMTSGYRSIWTASAGFKPKADWCRYRQSCNQWSWLNRILSQRRFYQDQFSVN